MSDSLPISDFRVYGPVIAASVTVTVWAASRIWEIVSQNRQARQRQGNLVRALFAEIDFNQRDMERFLAFSPSQEVIRQAILDNPKLVPHITDARHTEIYRSRIWELHTISDKVLRETVEFYGLLEKIRVQIESINYASFGTLSPEGRNNAVDVIRRTSFQASVCGAVLLEEFAKQHPQLALARLSRDTPQEEFCEDPKVLHARRMDIEKRLSEMKARRITQ